MKNDLFDGTRTPRPPADLRERALRAARTAASKAQEPARTGWGFNRFDLAWAAALVLLVLCNALVSLESRPVARFSAQPQATAESRQLQRELGLKGEFVIAAAPDTLPNGEAQRRVMQEMGRL